MAVIVVGQSTLSDRMLDELGRSGIVAERGDNVLARDPQASLYIFAFEDPSRLVILDAIIAWADRRRPGLIGVIDRGDSQHREAILAAGFDDAVITPYSARELCVRVRALDRRVARARPLHGRLRFGTFTLDVEGRALWIHGQVIALTTIELSVMRALFIARGRPLSRSELLEQAWSGEDEEISDRAVDNVILRLRRKLPRTEIIETVRGVGFRLAPAP